MRTIYMNTTSRGHQKTKYDWHLKRAGTLVEDRAILLAVAEADERDQQEIHHHCHSLEEKVLTDNDCNFDENRQRYTTHTFFGGKKLSSLFAHF